jgi:hypothetical protein
MLGLQSRKTRNVIRLMSTIYIKFLVIAVKLMLGLLERLMAMKLPANVTMLVRFSWLRTQVQELEHVILIPGIILFVNMSNMD